MSTDTAAPRLGEGIYTFARVASIIRNAVDPISAQTLRGWVRTGLVPADRYDPEIGEEVLTFEDLISLEVIRRLRREGHRPTSLQKIRRVEETLRSTYRLHRPFARRVFYTDGASVWAEIVGDDGDLVTIELHGKNPAHVVWNRAIATFADQIVFDEKGRARVWQPTPWVEIDPKRQFGDPVVTGTRVPVSTIKAQLGVASSAEVAEWYDLDVRAVEGVREYLALGA